MSQNRFLGHALGATWEGFGMAMGTLGHIWEHCIGKGSQKEGILGCLWDAF